jgi:hypothetical protein
LRSPEEIDIGGLSVGPSTTGPSFNLVHGKFFVLFGFRGILPKP